MSKTNALTKNTVVAASPNQVSADLAGEAAILHLKSGVYYGLNQVGAFIWSRIRSPIRVDQICQAVCEEFETTPQQCESDVLALLRRLADEGLIELRDGA